MTADPYEVLGVTRSASADDIKRAYRTLARKLHPDLNPGDTAAETRFKAVNSANDLLSDVDRRARFDRGEIDAEGNERGPSPGSGFSGGHWREHAEGAQGARYRRHAGGQGAEGFDTGDFEDLFGDYFRQSGARANAPQRGRDAQYALTVTFLDSVLGATRRLTLPDGRTLDVKIPSGIESASVLRLRGRGSPGRNGGPDGDALIEIVVAPHSVFTRDGDIIRLELPVSAREAVLGERVTVPTPQGNVAMKLPADADAGTVLRVRGKGIAARGKKPAGDVLVTLKVEIGPRDERLVDFLREWTPPDGPFDPRTGMLAEVRSEAAASGDAA